MSKPAIEVLKKVAAQAKLKPVLAGPYLLDGKGYASDGVMMLFCDDGEGLQPPEEYHKASIDRVVAMWPIKEMTSAIDLKRLKKLMRERKRRIDNKLVAFKLDKFAFEYKRLSLGLSAFADGYVQVHNDIGVGDDITPVTPVWFVGTNARLLIMPLSINWEEPMEDSEMVAMIHDIWQAQRELKALNEQVTALNTEYARVTREAKANADAKVHERDLAAHRLATLKAKMGKAIDSPPEEQVLAALNNLGNGK